MNSIENKLKILDMADSIREKINENFNKEKALADRWIKSKRSRKNSYYQPKAKKLKDEGNKLYSKYYYLIHNNFTNKEINDAMKGGDFLYKRFISNLRKQVKKGGNL